MNISFNLRNKKDQLTPIYVIVTGHNQRVRISTRQKVKTRFWNDATMRVRMQMGYAEGLAINAELDRIEAEIKELNHELIMAHRSISIDELKVAVIEIVENRRVKITPKGFWDHFDDFVTYKSRRHSRSIKKDYHNSLRKHLRVCEAKYGRPLTFEAFHYEIDGFCDILEHYLIYEALGADGQPGFSLNTVGKVIKNVKSFLNWSFEKGVTDRFSLKHLVTKTAEADTIYLTEEDVNLIERVEDLPKDEEVVRDLFLIGCETGLRFSDYSQLKPHNRQGLILKVYQKKTKNSVTIPISARTLRILEKYDNAPPNVSNVTIFNKLLRSVAQKAGIIEPVERRISKGHGLQTVVQPKYELVTSHTARRTFCTNKFLKGMPAQAIMQFSGHRTERDFMKYLKIDSKAAAVRYADFF